MYHRPPEVELPEVVRVSHLLPPRSVELAIFSRSHLIGSTVAHLLDQLDTSDADVLRAKVEVGPVADLDGAVQVRAWAPRS